MSVKCHPRTFPQVNQATFPSTQASWQPLPAWGLVALEEMDKTSSGRLRLSDHVLCTRVLRMGAQGPGVCFRFAALIEKLVWTGNSPSKFGSGFACLQPPIYSISSSLSVACNGSTSSCIFL